ncbi:hypothetical protein [Henriciella pelagia]|uniref:hypothetical protein n=1 Tax=Henriciella pelagia TaxID=1977912 RepID=UPI003515B6AC
MADPVSMTVMAAGTALSAYGKFEEGQQANKAGKYNRDVAYREAEQLDIQAEQEIAVASHRAQDIARRAKELMGTQRAAASAGGQASTDATSVALQQEAVKTSSLDQVMEMALAEERAQQIRYQGSVRRSEGDHARYVGKQRQRAAMISAGTTLLKGGASWYDKFGGWGGSTTTTGTAAHTGGQVV